MSKQPHVWVVEQKVGEDWAPEYLGFDRKDAKHQRALLTRLFGHSNKFRVAKYVRVEPKKGRKT